MNYVTQALFELELELLARYFILWVHLLLMFIMVVVADVRRPLPTGKSLWFAGQFNLKQSINQSINQPTGSAQFVPQILALSPAV